MSPITDAGAAHTAATAAYADLRAHDSAPAYKAVVAWLEALAAQQQAHMTSCAADRLPRAQLRLQQLVALRDALTPGDTGTGHVFD